MNNINVWLPIVTSISGFVFGAVITAGSDWAIIKSARKSAAFANFTANVLADACRKVLSDAWFRKVMREHQRAIDEYAAKEAR